MFQKILDFLKYHTISLIVGVLCIAGAGTAWAFRAPLQAMFSLNIEGFTPIPFSSNSTTAVDLRPSGFNLAISSISTDGVNYYIAYQAEVNNEQLLTISKKSLAGQDLGLYVANLLGSQFKSVNKDEIQRETDQLPESYGGPISPPLPPAPPAPVDNTGGTSSKSKSDSSSSKSGSASGSTSDSNSTNSSTDNPGDNPPPIDGSPSPTQNPPQDTGNNGSTDTGGTNDNGNGSGNVTPPPDNTPPQGGGSTTPPDNTGGPSIE
jgi:hypothetical protein